MEQETRLTLHERDDDDDDDELKKYIIIGILKHNEKGQTCSTNRKTKFIMLRFY